MKVNFRKLDLAQRRLRYRLASLPWAPWFPPTVDPNIFRGKRVIIIGPAETVLEDIGETVVDDYDVVIRLNNGIALSKTSPETLGRRTDILLHNLRETGDRSAGEIPSTYLNENNVNLVIFPHWQSLRQRNTFRNKRAELERGLGPLIQVLHPSFMEDLRTSLGGTSPTIGLCASAFALSSPAKEVAIHGFTFFQTKYAPTYNDVVKNSEDAKNWVRLLGAHDPVSEKIVFRDRVSNTNVSTVKLGKNLQKYLNAAD